MARENFRKSSYETVNLFLRSNVHQGFPQKHTFQEVPKTTVDKSNSWLNSSFKFTLQKNLKVVKSIDRFQFFINQDFYHLPKAALCSYLSAFYKYSLDQFKRRHVQAHVFKNSFEVPPRLTRNLQKAHLLKWLCDSNFTRQQFRTLLSRATLHYNPLWQV